MAFLSPCLWATGRSNLLFSFAGWWRLMVLYVYIKENYKSAWKITTLTPVYTKKSHACWNKHSKTSSVEPLFSPTCSETILRVKHHKGLFLPEESRLNFEIPSCLYDSNNQHSAAQLRTKCWGGVYGSNLSKQRTGEHARVGGSIICYVMPYYHKPLFYILFHSIVEGFWAPALVR